MAQKIDLKTVVKALPGDLRGALFSALPSMAVFAAIWTAAAVLSSSPNPMMQLGVWLALVGAASMIGVSVYRGLFKVQQGQTVLEDWLRVFAASLLIFAALAIIVFIGGLALVILTAILVAVSGHDPSGADPSDVSVSIETLQASGAIWLVYLAMITMTLLVVLIVARLSLFGAATTSRREIVVFQSWSMMRRAGLRALAVMAVLVLLPCIVMTVISGGITSQLGETAGALAVGGLVSLALLLAHTMAATVFRHLGDED